MSKKSFQLTQDPGHTYIYLCIWYLGSEYSLCPFHNLICNLWQWLEHPELAIWRGIYLAARYSITECRLTFGVPGRSSANEMCLINKVVKHKMTFRYDLFTKCPKKKILPNYQIQRLHLIFSIIFVDIDSQWSSMTIMLECTM